VVDALFSNALSSIWIIRAISAQGICNVKARGTLMMRLPLITLDKYSRRHISFDINFWKPCHRMLYTLKGLRR
jgi:hypothetical protein